MLTACSRTTEPREASAEGSADEHAAASTEAAAVPSEGLEQDEAAAPAPPPAVIDAAPGAVPTEAAPEAPSASSLPAAFAALPLAEVRVVIDVAAWNATLTGAAWNPFGRDAEAQASIWQRVVEPAGVRIDDPASLRVLALAWSPEGALVRARGSGLTSIGAATVRELAGQTEARRGQPLPEPPADAPAPPLPAQTTLHATWTPPQGAHPWPALDGTALSLSAYTDGALAVQFIGAAYEDVSGELGRGQVFASHALGQLRGSAPVELQGFVTLATRWHEALWAGTRLDDVAGGPRWVIAPARCGGMPRTWLAGAALAGLVTTAQHDVAAAPRPHVTMEARLLASCAPLNRDATLPRDLASLAEMQGADAESLLLLDAASWLRRVSPDAGGLLPFALPPDVVETALGARPLGLSSLAQPAPVALWWEAQPGRQTRRTAVLPAPTARWLGDAPLFAGTQPLLLDAERLILAPNGSDARGRLLLTNPPAWTAIATTAAPDSRLLYVLSRPAYLPLLGDLNGQDSPLGNALRDAEVVALEVTADGGWALRGWPAPAALDADALAADVAPWLRRRATAVLPVAVARRASTIERLDAMEAALTGAFRGELVGRTWVVAADGAAPWVRALIDVGVPALVTQIDRGAIGPLPAPSLAWPATSAEP